MLTVSNNVGFGSIAQPPDPNFSSVSLLMHGSGTNGSTTFVDSSSFARAATAAGNAQISTSEYKYGNASMLFDGSGDYVSFATATALDVRAGAFTIEGWVMHVDGSPGTLFCRASSSGVTYEHVFGFTTVAAEVYYGIRGTNQACFKFAWPTTMVVNEWHHIVIQRDGSGNWAAYLDGVISPTYQIAPLAASLVFGAVTPGTYNNAIDFQGTTLTPSIASNVPGIYQFKGYMNDVRLTKGVARYSGSTFALPNGPFPNY